MTRGHSLRRVRSFGILVLLSLTACAEIHFHRTFEVQPTAEPKTMTYQFVGWGLKDLTHSVRLNELCAQDWEDLTLRKNRTQSLLTVVTLGFYSPWSVELRCHK